MKFALILTVVLAACDFSEAWTLKGLDPIELFCPETVAEKKSMCESVVSRGAIYCDICCDEPEYVCPTKPDYPSIKSEDLLKLLCPLTYEARRKMCFGPRRNGERLCHFSCDDGYALGSGSSNPMSRVYINGRV